MSRIIRDELIHQPYKKRNVLWSIKCLKTVNINFQIGCIELLILEVKDKRGIIYKHQFNKNLTDENCKLLNR